MKIKNIIRVLVLTGIASGAAFAADRTADAVNKGATIVKEQAQETAFDVKKFFADLKEKWDNSSIEQDALDADKTVDHQFNITYAAYSILPEAAQKEVIEYLAKTDNTTLRNIGLHMVAKDGREQIVDCFVANGGSIQSTDEKGNTLLDIAVLSGNVGGVGVILKKGAAVNAKNARGETALFPAARHGAFAIVKLLIDSGADSDIKDNNQQTPLFAAAISGDVDIAQLLIDHGGQVNAVDNKGNTPLHIAVEHKQLAMVSFLISKGARTDIRNKNQQMPSDIARKEHYNDIGKALAQ